MSRTTVGLMGPRFDDEVQVLIRALRERGARVRVLDLTGLPGAHRLEIADDAVTYDGRSVAEVGAFYLRRTRAPADAKALLELEQPRGGETDVRPGVERQLTRERELNALIASALGLLSAPIINPPEAQFVHPRKTLHLRTLAAAQLPVPPFVATNDPAVLQDFVAAQGDSGVCVKPLRGLLKTQLYDAHHPPDLTQRPVLLQQYVPGVTVRVYAVGGRPVAAGEMDNQGHVDSSVDPLPPRSTDLTAEETALVHRATRAVGLPFTGMDLQRPRAGGPSWVLECNAAPMFANFCRLTGADVAGALADYLLARAQGKGAWIDSSPPSV